MYVVDFFEPLGSIMGLDGVILTAFILGIPANEIVLPIVMMIYMSQGTLAEVNDLEFFYQLLVSNGWTYLTALNVMIFSMMHWPCATTLLSIKKESGSWKWAGISFIAPLMMGIGLCVITTSVSYTHLLYTLQLVLLWVAQHLEITVRRYQILLSCHPLVQVPTISTTQRHRLYMRLLVQYLHVS